MKTDWNAEYDQYVRAEFHPLPAGKYVMDAYEPPCPPAAPYIRRRRTKPRPPWRIPAPTPRNFITALIVLLLAALVAVVLVDAGWRVAW